MKEHIKIEGMSCGSCAMTVEKALKKVPGVQDVNVNLATHEAVVEENNADKDAMYQAIKKAGYTPVMPEESLKFAVSGMSCGSCAMTVEKAVQSLDHVEEAKVNLANESLVVSGSQLDAEAIEQAVKKAGYSAQIENGEKQEVSHDSTSPSLKRRLIVSLIFTIPLLYISMGAMINMPGAAALMNHPSLFAAIQLILTLPVLYEGRAFFIQGWKALRVGAPNMDSLVAMGTSAAFLYSVYNAVTVFLGNDGGIHHLYFESAATILTLVTLGNFFEAKSKGKASQAIYALLSLAPDTAWMKQNGEWVQVPVENLKPHDMIQVKPGEKVPIDGRIVQGTTTIDESMITGESQPVVKEVGDDVIGGSVNHNGVLQVEVLKTGNDTLLHKMVQLVEDAQANKAPIAKLVDKVSAIFVPTVMILALLSAVLWKTVGHEGWNFAITIFVSVLVIACPCALGLATPMALMIGTGRGAKEGILIKNNAALERLNQIDAIVFDKTGTLTIGKPSVTKVAADDETTLLQLAASLEQHSEHPLAKAVVKKAEEEGLTIVEAKNVQAKVGQGVQGDVDGHHIVIGNQRLMEALNLEMNRYKEIGNHMLSEGKTAIFVARDDQVIGVLGIEDPIKEDARDMIQRLKEKNITPILMTGDHRLVANEVAKKLGIETVFSEVYPEDKANLVKQKQEEGRKVAMVGDGINDAPALATADVGMAMGSGTDIAIESADVVLMNHELTTVLEAIQLSSDTMRNVKENLIWAFGYNVLGIPIAMGVLYLFGGPLLNPMIAGAAMSLSSVSVVLNALRLRVKRHH